MTKTQQPTTIDDTKQRIDRWLWHARIAKTRALAQKLALSGRVRINKKRVQSASDQVRVGDVVTVAMPHSVRILQVTGFLARRGNADAAMLTCREATSGPPSQTASRVERQSASQALKSGHAPKTQALSEQTAPGLPPVGQPRPMAGGRPTKRARRAYDKSTRPLE